MTNIIGPNGPNRCSRGSLGGEVPTFQGEKTNLEKGKLTVLSTGLTGHAGETAIFKWEIGVKCGRFITLFLMLNISTDLP